MPFTADEIILAFIEQTSHSGTTGASAECDETDTDVVAPAGEAQGSVGRHVTFGRRGPSGHTSGYVRVWGPSADRSRNDECHIIIERLNGAVAVTERILNTGLGAVARPLNVGIDSHTLGFSSGPKFGRFGHAIPPSAMGPGLTHAMPRDLVAALAAAFAKAGLTW